MRRTRKIWCCDLGLADFHRTHKLQLDILEARVSGKIDRDVVLVLEHPPVFTMGRRGGRNHLKVSAATMKEACVELFHIERGGDITFHGPGQLVLYPIFHLRHSSFSVVEFVEYLEEVMILTAKEQGIPVTRNSRNHGVWTDDQKLGFVGIAVRRSVSYHGIALNVNLSLAPFDWIDPCGMPDVRVTSLDQASEHHLSVTDVKPSLLQNMENVFSITLKTITHEELKGLIH